MRTSTILVFALATASFSPAEAVQRNRTITKRSATTFNNRLCDRWLHIGFSTGDYRPVGTPERPADTTGREWYQAVPVKMNRIINNIVRKGLLEDMSEEVFMRDFANLGPRPLSNIFLGFSNTNDISALITEQQALYNPPLNNPELTIPGAIQKFLYDYSTICEIWSTPLYPAPSGCTATDKWRIDPRTGARNCQFNPNSGTTGFPGDPNTSPGVSFDPMEVLRKDGYFNPTRPMWQTTTSGLGGGVSAAVFNGDIDSMVRPTSFVDGGFRPELDTLAFNTFAWGGLSTATTGSTVLRGWQNFGGLSAARNVNQHGLVPLINAAFGISAAINRARAQPNWESIRAGLAANPISGACPPQQCVCASRVVTSIQNPVTGNNDILGTMPPLSRWNQYWNDWSKKPFSQEVLYATPGAFAPVCGPEHFHMQTGVECRSGC